MIFTIQNPFFWDLGILILTPQKRCFSGMSQGVIGGVSWLHAVTWWQAAHLHALAELF